jgi:hypothetical protein
MNPLKFLDRAEFAPSRNFLSCRKDGGERFGTSALVTVIRRLLRDRWFRALFNGNLAELQILRVGIYAILSGGNS